MMMMLNVNLTIHNMHQDGGGIYSHARGCTLVLSGIIHICISYMEIVIECHSVLDGL